MFFSTTYVANPLHDPPEAQKVNQLAQIPPFSLGSNGSVSTQVYRDLASLENPLAQNEFIIVQLTAVVDTCRNYAMKEIVYRKNMLW